MSCQIIALSFIYFEFHEILCFWCWPTTNTFPWSLAKFSSWPSSSVYEWICAFLVQSYSMSSFALASFAMPQEIPRKGCHIAFQNFFIWLYKIFAFDEMDKFKTLFSMADSGVLIVSMGSSKKSRIPDSRLPQGACNLNLHYLCIDKKLSKLNHWDQGWTKACSASHPLDFSPFV